MSRDQHKDRYQQQNTEMEAAPSQDWLKTVDPEEDSPAEISGRKLEEARHAMLLTEGQKRLLQRYEQMERLASYDALTGLLNRGTLEQRIKDRLLTMSEGENCALIVLDLDHFKAVNDTLGHQAGDQVLRDAGRVLSRLFRSTDIVGRLGGDEFAIFLSGDISEELVRKKGQLLCDQLQFVVGADGSLVVTASVGICLTVGGERRFSALYRAADRALYRAKENGRQTYSLTTDNEAVVEEPVSVSRQVNATRLRALLDNIDNGLAMIEIDEPMRFLYVSPSFARMLGRSVEEVRELPVLDIIHPDDRSGLIEQIRHHVLSDNEPYSHICRVIRSSGEFRWWRIRAVQVDESDNAPSILLTATDISDSKGTETDLRDIYQVVMDQATQGVWEVDIRTRSFRILGHSQCFAAELQQPIDFPNGLLRMGWIDQSSQDSFRDFAQALLEGREQGYANFKVEYQEPRGWNWAAFSYRTMLDDEGLPMEAVGVINALDRWEEKSASRVKKHALPEGLTGSLVAQASGNLTRDTVNYYWAEGTDRLYGGGDQSCGVVFSAEANRVAEADRGLNDLFSQDALLAAVRDPKGTWLYREYRRIDSDSCIHRVYGAIRLYADPTSREILFRLWIMDVERRYQWETQYLLPLYRVAQELYAPVSLRDLGRNLASMGGSKLCGLALVEVKGLSALQVYDEARAQSVRQGLVCALLLGMGGQCVTGQISSDCYGCFFPDVESYETLERQLEQMIDFVQQQVGLAAGGPSLRLLVGGACVARSKAMYDTMMRQAQEILASWRNAEGDRVVFTDISRDEDDLRRREAGDRVRTDKMEEIRPLADREKDAALSSLLQMLSSPSIEASAQCVLRTLGEFYSADRVYIIELADGGKTVTVPHEWTSHYKWALQSVMTGTLAAHYPLLERCIREDRPIFLSRSAREDAPEGEEGEAARRTWRFAIFPMREEGDSTNGYMCVENARHHMSDATLPMLLCSCLLRQRRRYLAPTQTGLGEDAFYHIDLPNHSSYMERIYSFHSDVYHSLGAVCVDVPDLSHINNVQGFAYGRQILRQIARIMTELFGATMVYRTWDAEFVALCPNTTQQVFYGRCIRLRTVLERHYPKVIRIGYNWSDKVFSGKELVDEAKTLMRGGGNDRQRVPVNTLPLPLAQYSSVREMIAANCFTVYLQPKIDLSDGSLAGAELLVRAIGDGSRPIAPIQFLERFEQDGSIRDLDFFVLDKALQLLSAWKNKGNELLPLSVNFSRVTLFDPQAPGAVLAITSRYPDVPEGLITAEVTDSVGDADQNTLQQTLERFRAFGLRFALDDLGSKFSRMAAFTGVPFEEVKLDRALVAELPANEKSMALMQSIVAVCQQEGIRCVGEGVENVQQANALHEAGCMIGQGFYFDRPMPEPMFYEKYLADRANAADKADTR